MRTLGIPLRHVRTIRKLAYIVTNYHSCVGHSALLLLVVSLIKFLHDLQCWLVLRCVSRQSRPVLASLRIQFPVPEHHTDAPLPWHERSKNSFVHLHLLMIVKWRAYIPLPRNTINDTVTFKRKKKKRLELVFYLDVLSRAI